MKVLILEPNLYDATKLTDLGIFVDEYDFTSQKELDEHLTHSQYDCIFTKLGLKLFKEQINTQKELKVIATPTTGLNHINVEYAKQRGVKLLSLKDERDFLRQISTTAEHAWMLMLMCLRSIRKLLEKTDQLCWDRSNIEIYQARGKHVGIIGLGRLGSIIEGYCNAFGMNVSYYDIDPNVRSSRGNKSYELETIVSESDVIFLTASYEKSQDQPILNKKLFSLFKPGSIFINIARGELVDHEALIKSLDMNIIAAAGLDVLPNDSAWNASSSELLMQNSIYKDLMQKQNVYLTPHVGGYAFEAISLTRSFILDKFIDDLKSTHH